MDQDFSPWIGRQEETTDRLEAARTHALSAALCGPASPYTGLADGDPLPLLHHWLYFWNVIPPEGLGDDGHPARGGFLPPVALPRRMWAGGRLTFVQPLIVGERVTRVSTILDVKTKTGKSGSLVFVTVRHELSGESGLSVIEEQDIVYREAAVGGGVTATAERVPSQPVAAWRRDIMPDAVLLFRYSALTMNGHRIHYDRPYAMNDEAYPALVVHGPLQATLLAALAAEHLDATITGFEFRGHSPAFDGITLNMCGERSAGGASVWTEQGGTKNMVATVICGGN